MFNNKMVGWDKIVEFDEQHIKDNLLKQEKEEAKILINQIKIISSCIERSKRERRFIDDNYETPEIKFKFNHPRSSVIEEINSIKDENHRMEVMLKSMAQMFVDKNNSIYDNRKLAKEIQDLFVLPEGPNNDYKDFQSLKSMLEIFYKNIIKLILDRIELETKTEAIETKGHELSEKYRFLYYYTKDSQDLTEQDSLVASINSIDVENCYLQLEIERMIADIEKLQEDFKRFDNLSLSDMNNICNDTVHKNLRFINLLYENEEMADTTDDLSGRAFTDDSQPAEEDPYPYGIDISKMIPLKKKIARELTELTYKLNRLKKNALNDKHLY